MPKKLTKKELIELWWKLYHSEKVSKEFKQMTMGNHCGELWMRDGWRDLILKKENACVIITLEKYPSRYLIYSGKHRFYLSNNEGDEMVKAWEKRGTLTELPIERIDELL